MLKDHYPALWQFLGAYLHQDWREEYDDAFEALADFFESEPEVAALLAPEIDTVLAERSTEELEQLLLELGSSYIPSRSGQDARDWLTSLRASTPSSDEPH